MPKYSIILEYDEEARSYSVVVPALPGCATFGDTIEECIANAREAISGHIAALRDLGVPVPEERERPQVITLDIADVADAEVAAKSA
ncbi:MAG: type II toxin-antitoxin system HicB family antitoxin [Chloroflexi bacterium]|nr:type II toxin-antitoxin system HicB family antitoxin [Chloroflexota bacterium]